MGYLDEYKPVMSMILIQSVYAGTNLISRVGLLQGLSPSVYLFYRQGAATIFIFPIAVWKRPSILTSLTLRSFAWIFIAAFIGVTLNLNLYYIGMSLSNSSVAAAMGNLIPVITFVLTSALVLERVDIRTKRSVAKIVGTIVCVSGAMSMALLKGPKLLNHVIGIPPPPASGNDGDWLWGALFLFGSCFLGSSWLIIQVPVSESYPDHLSMSAWLCFFSMLQSGVVTCFLEQDHEKWRLSTNLQIACCLYTGIIGSPVCYFLQAWCIKQRGPLYIAMFNPLSTILTSAFAAILLHEKIFAGSLAGAVGVIIGLYVVLWGKAEEYADIIPKAKADSIIDCDKVDLEELLLCDKSCDDMTLKE